MEECYYIKKSMYNILKEHDAVKESVNKLEKESQKNIMESSKVKIYGSPTYQPSVRERPYFERKDVSFLKQLISGR